MEKHKTIKRESFYLQGYNLTDCKNKVLNYQEKIYESAKRGESSLIKTYQKYLVKSEEACYLAVRKVCTNKGGMTAGIDGFIPKRKKDYEDLIRFLRNLNNDDYKAKPLKRFWIPKVPPSTDKRPLSIPTIHDRCVQALWALALDPVNEAYSDDHNYGFRQGRSPADAQLYLQKQLARPGASELILEIDIKKCFDSIDHKYIIETVPVNRKILKQWLNCGVMDADSFYYDEKGVPQGGIISPVICNLVLNGFEAHIKEHIQKLFKSKQITLEETRFFLFCRFADDMIIVAKTNRVIEICRSKLEQFLSVRGLNINEKKTKVTHISDGFKFLGFFFKLYLYTKPRKKIIRVGYVKKLKEYSSKGIVLAVPPDESLSSILKNINKLLYSSTDLIDMKNKVSPRINGYCNYYKVCNWGKGKSKFGHYLYLALVKWLMSRFGISKRKAYLTYFKDSNTFHFKNPNSNLKNEKEYIEMYLPPYFKKCKYPFISSDWKPYGKTRTLFFEHLERKIRYTLSQYQNDILSKTDNRCRNCYQLLTDPDINLNYDLHHVQPREFGGSNDKTNFIALCRPCHRYVSGVQQSRNLQNAMELISKRVLKIPSPYLSLFKKDAPPQEENFNEDKERNEMNEYKDEDPYDI